MKVEIKTNFEVKRLTASVSDAEEVVQFRKEDMERYLTPESVEAVVEAVDERFRPNYSGRYYLEKKEVEICMEYDLHIPKSFVFYSVIRNYVYAVYQVRMSKNYLKDELDKLKGFDGD